jgi:hypothetical protein
MLVANDKNIKRLAKNILGNEYNLERARELVRLCTKKDWKDYHKPGYHHSFALVDWLTDIDKVICGYGVEAVRMDGLYYYYINTGDVYSLTFYYYRDKMRIGTLADLIEKCNCEVSKFTS